MKKTKEPANELTLLQAKAQREALEREFYFGWMALKPHDLPDPIWLDNGGQFQFVPDKGYKFDFCWLYPYKVAVEIEGGIYNGGRHTRGKGFEEDCRKYNRAAKEGWTVLRLGTLMVKNELPEHVQVVIDVLRKNKAKNKAEEASLAALSTLQRLKNEPLGSRNFETIMLIEGILRGS